LERLTRRERLLAALFLATLVAAATVLYLVSPEGTKLFPPCPFHWATGWKCPGCGSLRASHALLHGNLGAAWRLNPLALLFLPLLLWYVVDWLVGVFAGRRLPRIMPSPVVAYGLVGLFVIYGIARNL